MHKSKKILVISPTPTHPQNAGNRIRIYNLVSNLKKLGHDVHFLYEGKELTSNHVEKASDINAMKEYWKNRYHLMPIKSRFIEYFNKFVWKFGLFLKKHIPKLYSKLRKCKFNFYINPTINKFNLRCFVDRIFGLFGIFLKKYSPKLYLKLKKKDTSKFINLIPESDFEFKRLNNILYKKKKNRTHQIDSLYNKYLDNVLIKLSKKENFDVVIVEYVFLSKALEIFGDNVLKIIDTHDIFTNRHNIYLKNGVPLEFFSTTIKEEARGLNRADVIFAIQDKEKKFFSKLTNKKVVTIGHTVELRKLPQKKIHGNNLLFVGAINEGNIQGINYFIKKVFPKVRSEIPTTKLLIVGKICDKVKEDKGIIKLGEIKDLKNAYDMADILIGPLFLGTGLKIKNIEALGYSKPLVTTPHGAEGLEKGIGTSFLVADTPKKFASSIINILLDEKLYTNLSKNSYNFAKEYNKKTIDELDKVFKFKK